MATKTKPKARNVNAAPDHKRPPAPPAPRSKATPPANNVRFAVTFRHIDTLIPFARNARQHSELQINKLAALMQTFGWTSVILVDGESGIIAGHARVMAARHLIGQGVTSLRNLPDLLHLPCVDGSHMSADQRLAFSIADNRVALEASWDAEALSSNLFELQAADINLLALTALSEDELKAALSPAFSQATNPAGDDGSNLKGIAAVLKVSIAKADMDRTRNMVKDVLDDAGVSYEFV